MSNIIGIFYSVIFLSFALAALFIVFHIVRYSINKTSSLVMLVVFISVFSVLLISNMVLFFSVPWEQMFDFINLGGGNF
ncbi:hypothetical protein J7J13_00645 [bacterium]|nr:hypothetical protein [bacterium]